MSESPIRDLFRVCVKLYAPEPVGIESDAATFVPIFHEWIRDGVLDLVLFDVADYAHVPDGPGIMLVTHETAFGLDRSDGRFGLLAQRRTPVDGDAVTAVETTIRDAVRVASRLAADERLAGKLDFDGANLRVEANDRLRAPNTDNGYERFEPIVRSAVARVFGATDFATHRVLNDPRDRLAVEVRIGSEQRAQDHIAA